MHHVDRLILNHIQNAFPLDPRPYRLVAEDAGISEVEAWQRVQTLRKDSIIRRIGGIFDSRRLGYISTLCAAHVPAEKIDILADWMNSVNEITHNYLRDHYFNMWFTIIAVSKTRLDDILDKVKAILSSDEVYSLPAKRVFKIGVHFDLVSNESNPLKIIDDQDSKDSRWNIKKENNLNNLSSNKNTMSCIRNPKTNKASSTNNNAENCHCENTTGITESALKITEDDKALIRLLQEDLSQSLTPFHDLASQLGRDESFIIQNSNKLLNHNVMRRLGAVLVHHKAGFTSNAMGVWMVPKEKIVETGTIMAQFKEVSHCYERPSLPDWPYNVFTMIHGQSDADCQEIINRIAQATRIQDHAMLFSQSELKKSSMRYFIEDPEKAFQPNVI